MTEPETAEYESEDPHPKRERWRGQVDELPYKTEAFDGGERVAVTYRDLDGVEQSYKGEVGEYMSHNSWLMIFVEDVSPEYRVPDFTIRRDGIALIQPYMDGDLFPVGRCESVERVRAQNETLGGGGRV